MLHFIKTMAPGWFAAVMGTSVSSLAAELLFGATSLSWLSDAFHWIAIAMLVVLGIAAVLRIVLFPKLVWETISHPVEGSFYATFPISMLVMAGEWSIRGVDAGSIAALWWVGMLGTFAASSLILFRLFTSEKLTLSMVTPGHFIPAVGLVVIPVAGASIAGASQGLLREVYFGINMLGMGAGSFMYVALVAITMARHFLAAPIEGKMTPTLWVHLAPLGVIPLSLLSLLHASGNEAAFGYGLLVAMAFMGASLWWLCLAAAITIRNVLRKKLPFALSWWAFVFPVGASTVLAARLSDLAHLTLLPMIAQGLMAVLLFVWCAAAAGTVRGLLRGTVVPQPGAHPAH